ncbi:MAG: hypothetical protein HFI41_00800 [Lachnospiraceae bacterium]|nr:hypothetical protein [Lachnospiraceae bacterium]
MEGCISRAGNAMETKGYEKIDTSSGKISRAGNAMETKGYEKIDTSSGKIPKAVINY